MNNTQVEDISSRPGFITLKIKVGDLEEKKSIELFVKRII